MDPIKALDDLDKVLQGVPADRSGHAHIIKCVLAIKQALTAAVTTTE